MWTASLPSAVCGCNTWTGIVSAELWVAVCGRTACCHAALAARWEEVRVRWSWVVKSGMICTSGRGWGGQSMMGHMKEKCNTYRVLVGKPEGKRLLSRPRHSWENNMKINIQDKWWKAVDQIHLAQDWDKWQALAKTVMNLSVPQKSGNFLTNLDTITFSRNALYDARHTVLGRVCKFQCTAQKKT